MQASRELLLELDNGLLHAALANLRVLEVVPVELLVARAGKLYQQFKPNKLLASRVVTFTQCASSQHHYCYN